MLGVASCAFAASSLGSLQETIGVGKLLSIGLNQSASGTWYVFSNSNKSVASVKANSNSLLITGLSVGSTTTSVCTDAQGSHCQQVAVTVGGTPQVLGASTVVPHPYKSWVIQGQTVFYVDTNGLIPITTWQIFLSNGGKQSLIQPADSADLSLTLEPLMLPHDPRVHN